MTQNDRLISALEVAYRADLHPATIYRKGLKGEIPGLVKLGKTIRFKESVIEAGLKGEKASGKPLDAQSSQEIPEGTDAT